jgi:hypothetical protein
MLINIKIRRKTLRWWESGLRLLCTVSTISEIPERTYDDWGGNCKTSAGLQLAKIATMTIHIHTVRVPGQVSCLIRSFSLAQQPPILIHNHQWARVA